MRSFFLMSLIFLCSLPSIATAKIISSSTDSGKFETSIDLFNGNAPSFSHRFDLLNYRAGERKIVDASVDVPGDFLFDKLPGFIRRCGESAFTNCGNPPRYRTNDFGTNMFVKSSLDVEKTISGSFGSGNVDLGQSFDVQIDIEQKNDQHLSISSSFLLGETKLSSAISAAALKSETSVDLDIDLRVREYFLRGAVKDYYRNYGVDEEFTDFSIAIGEGAIALNPLGLGELEIPLEAGFKKEFGFGVNKIIGPKFIQPAGDITVYTTDMAGSITSDDGNGEVSLAFGRDGNSEVKLSFLEPTPNINEGDLIRFDTDIDLLATSGVGLGIEAGINPVTSLQGNLLDFDSGMLANLAQNQEFTSGDIDIVLDFSIPVQVLQHDGSYALVTQHLLRAGESLDIIQPNVDFEISSSYLLSDSTYENDLTLNLFGVNELKLFNAEFRLLPGFESIINGGFNQLRDVDLPSWLGDFLNIPNWQIGNIDSFHSTSLLEANAVVGGIPQISLYDSSLSVNSFQRVQGSRFTIQAMQAVSAPNTFVIIMISGLMVIWHRLNKSSSVT